MAITFNLHVHMYYTRTCFLPDSPAVTVASSSACSPTEHWPGTTPEQISSVLRMCSKSNLLYLYYYHIVFLLLYLLQLSSQ